jgi:hypothetical protein
VSTHTLPPTTGNAYWSKTLSTRARAVTASVRGSSRTTSVVVSLAEQAQSVRPSLPMPWQ